MSARAPGRGFRTHVASEAAGRSGQGLWLVLSPETSSHPPTRESAAETSPRSKDAVSSLVSVKAQPGLRPREMPSPFPHGF